MNLLENPFHVLGASTRDDRRRLLERADERALSIDPTICAKARADLGNPRNRVAAEVAWLPGMDPAKADELVRSLAAGRPRQAEQDLNPLAAANLSASALARCTSALSVDEAAERIGLLAEAHEDADPYEVQRLIDEDRKAAGFPAIADGGLVEHALAEQRRFYREAIWAALDQMPTRDIVAAITRVVERATRKGNKHAPILVDEVVDAFEGEARGFLETESENARRLLAAVSKAAGAGAPRPNLEPLFGTLESVIRNWDSVAQPLQLSSMSRGLDHSPSLELASAIRNTALVLNNEHGLLWAAQRLTSIVRDVFAEVPRIVEFIEKDVVALQQLATERASRGRS